MDTKRNIEYRELTTAELRSDPEKKMLSGLAVPYNHETVIGGLFREIMRPGAFRRAIDGGQDVVAWYQHGKGSPIPLGRTTATPPTLRLNETPEGVGFEIDTPDTQSANELHAAIARGDIRGVSIAFDVPEPAGEAWNFEETRSGKLPLREVSDADLFDVSPVVWPAYKGTVVNARSAEEVLEAHKPVVVPVEPVVPEQVISEPEDVETPLLEAELALYGSTK